MNHPSWFGTKNDSDTIYSNIRSHTPRINDINSQPPTMIQRSLAPTPQGLPHAIDLSVECKNHDVGGKVTACWKYGGLSPGPHEHMWMKKRSDDAPIEVIKGQCNVVSSGEFNNVYYTLKEGDVGCLLQYAVLPTRLDGTVGEWSYSDWIRIEEAPQLIPKTLYVGVTVRTQYPENKARHMQFKWVRIRSTNPNTSLLYLEPIRQIVGMEPYYLLQEDDVGCSIQCSIFNNSKWIYSKPSDVIRKDKPHVNELLVQVLRGQGWKCDDPYVFVVVDGQEDHTNVYRGDGRAEWRDPPMVFRVTKETKDIQIKVMSETDSKVHGDGHIDLADCHPDFPVTVKLEPMGWVHMLVKHRRVACEDETTVINEVMSNEVAVQPTKTEIPTTKSREIVEAAVEEAIIVQNTPVEYIIPAQIPTTVVQNLPARVPSRSLDQIAPIEETPLPLESYIPVTKSNSIERSESRLSNLGSNTALMMDSEPVCFTEVKAITEHGNDADIIWEICRYGYSSFVNCKCSTCPSKDPNHIHSYIPGVDDIYSKIRCVAKKDGKRISSSPVHIVTYGKKTQRSLLQLSSLGHITLKFIIPNTSLAAQITLSNQGVRLVVGGQTTDHPWSTSLSMQEFGDNDILFATTHEQYELQSTDNERSLVISAFRLYQGLSIPEISERIVGDELLAKWLSAKAPFTIIKEGNVVDKNAKSYIMAEATLKGMQAAFELVTTFHKGAHSA
eukprot:NODE_536_length_2620_cov_123.675611_g460_i0.p1 GENE.NODE_536_length_2620_cov_123.675611_g460_i0~~NODE_536_length_2620_cov_123.675611_g460_i0.p1  ORF type:complete len:850 (+),score=183.85 NODE_536_length_2620_cov_123.675611_g460_i0:381-2552(+)